MHKFGLYRYLGHGRFVGGVGGSKRKRPNDVVGEQIDMFVAPNRYILYYFPILRSGKHRSLH